MSKLNGDVRSDFKGTSPGLYIHVPFCRSKCPYCAFYSLPSPSLIPIWLEGLKKEMVMYQGVFDPFDTLYVGGGTPTCLGEEVLTDLMGHILSRFDFTRDPELTVEANPRDLTEAKIAILKNSGFNRVNVGIQSFDNRVLSFLGRRHRVEDGTQALKRLRYAGFENMGIDLIYGIRVQGLKGWLKTLDAAVSFHPEHISCYELTIEQKTVFGRLCDRGQLNPVSESEAEEYFTATSEYLEDLGYVHYEISNFARKGRYRSRHNLKYWRHVPYLGLGPSAHSFHRNRRWWNLRSIRKYCAALSEGRPPVEASEDLSREQLLMETLALGLRTMDGVDMAALRDLPGTGKTVSELKESGHVRVIDGRLIPTTKGFLVADQIPLAFLGG